MSEASVSLNKWISSTGICSRREADRWIEAGRVRINGNLAQKGNRVTPADQVTLDGKPLTARPKAVYLKFFKPPGITTTTDRRDKSNIVDFLNYPERIFPIGRLDKNSSGLLLLTNDGDVVNRILRKENRHEKEYIVTVDRPLTAGFLKRIERPVPMLGTRTLPCRTQRLSERVFRIILTQGLNRQIRRMCEFGGYRVLALKRVRIMHIGLGDLQPGEWQPLSDAELGGLPLG